MISSESARRTQKRPFARTLFRHAEVGEGRGLGIRLSPRVGLNPRRRLRQFPRQLPHADVGAKNDLSGINGYFVICCTRW